MKKIIKGILASALVLSLFGCSQKSDTVDEKVEDAKPVREVNDTWSKDTKDESMTLMIYMIGSDLESGSGSATNDMNEMLANTYDYDKVNVIVCAGGSEQWHNGFSSEEKSVHQLTKDGFKQLESWDVTSMGDATSLSNFLEYGYSNFKADNYALVLWNHGNGPLIGYGMDKQFDNDSLTLVEMKEALENSPFKKEKLEFIGFDACLMSSVEVACYMSDYSKYLIASQEVEPNFGWNYDFLDRLGKIDTIDLTKKITNSYITYCDEYFSQNTLFESDVTLAVMDLSKADKLKTAVNELFKKASRDVSGGYNQLAKNRVRTRSLGRATTGSEYDLVDLNDLVNCMMDEYPDQCEEIQSILEDMIVSNVNNTENVCGMSIYYPYFNKNYYTNSWKNSYNELDLFPDYITFLNRYEKIWLANDLKKNYDEFLNPENEDGRYVLNLTPSQDETYAKSGYYILRRTGQELYQPVYFSSNTTYDNGKITANFDGNIIYLDDLGEQTIPAMVETDTVNETTYYSISVTATAGTSKYTYADLQLALNNETGEVSIKSLTQKDEDAKLNTGKQKPVDLESNKYLVFPDVSARYLSRDENDQIMDFFEWQEGDWFTGYEVPAADPFDFVYKPIYDDGYEYYIMFRVEDVQNNAYSSELLPITLQKEPEVKKTYTKIDDVDSNKVLIYDENDVKVTIEASRDFVSDETLYFAKIENNTDSRIEVEFKNLIVNEIYSDPRSYYAFVDGNSIGYLRLESIELLGLEMGCERIDSLSYRLHISEDTDLSAKTIQPWKYYTFNFGKDVPLESEWTPYLDAMAKDNQVVYNKDGVEISVMHAGYIFGSDSSGATGQFSDLSVCLMATNTTDEEVELIMDGFIFNGLYMKERHKISVAPHEKTVKKIDVDFTSFADMMISSIETMDLVIEGQSYPIELVQKGKKEELNKELIYEDDMLAAYLVGSKSEYNPLLKKTENAWYILFENKSNQNLLINHERDYLVDGKKSDNLIYTSYKNLLLPKADIIFSIQCNDYNGMKNLTVHFGYTIGDNEYVDTNEKVDMGDFTFEVGK